MLPTGSISPIYILTDTFTFEFCLLVFDYNLKLMLSFSQIFVASNVTTGGIIVSVRESYT